MSEEDLDAVDGARYDGDTKWKQDRKREGEGVGGETLGM